MILSLILLLSTGLPAKATIYNGFDYGAGDILVTKSTSSSGLVGHSAIILRDGKSVLHIQAPGYTPTVIPIATWFSKYPSTKVVRCNNTTTRVNASLWAESYYANGAGKTTEYSITPNPRDLTKTYCSEIVWQSFYYGANFSFKTFQMGYGGNYSYNEPVVIEPYNFLGDLTYNGFTIVNSVNWN